MIFYDILSILLFRIYYSFILSCCSQEPVVYFLAYVSKVIQGLFKGLGYGRVFFDCDYWNKTLVIMCDLLNGTTNHDRTACHGGSLRKSNRRNLISLSRLEMRWVAQEA
jgi:hypothetical protein